MPEAAAAQVSGVMRSVSEPFEYFDSSFPASFQPPCKGWLVQPCELLPTFDHPLPTSPSTASDALSAAGGQNGSVLEGFESPETISTRMPQRWLKHPFQPNALPAQDPWAPNHSASNKKADECKLPLPPSSSSGFADWPNTRKVKMKTRMISWI